jgi:hypothetical protein
MWLQATNLKYPGRSEILIFDDKTPVQGRGGSRKLRENSP